jgi:signal transduction histidine kinase
MKTVTKTGKEPRRGFEEMYRSAFQTFAVRNGEEGLIHAYELGRGGLKAGKSLLEIASLHHEALMELFNESSGAEHRTEFLRASAAFLGESLSPYEMAHRGFQDAVKALRQLNETLEEEIKRIAHAVHDEAGQLLVAVRLALADVERELPKTQQEHCKQIEQLLDQVEEQLRRYSHDLRPTILDDLGWLPAIRVLAERVSKRADLSVRVKTTFDGRLPGAVEIAIYRIVQEALTNVTKHAQASRVSIQVRRSGGVLSCSIRDDGAGFDPAAVRSDRSRSGLGLIGMQERLSAIGGMLAIDSAPGRGTKLLIKVPVLSESSDGDSGRSRG